MGDTLETDKVYTVATNEFLADGSDGYDTMTGSTNFVYYGGDAEAFASYLATNP